MEDFLYQDGPNPFVSVGGGTVAKGIGVVRDAFHPDYERPNGPQESEVTEFQAGWQSLFSLVL